MNATLPTSTTLVQKHQTSSSSSNHLHLPSIPPSNYILQKYMVVAGKHFDEFGKNGTNDYLGPASDGMDSMEVKDLRKIAEDKTISTDGMRSRQEIARAIRGATPREIKQGETFQTHQLLDRLNGGGDGFIKFQRVDESVPTGSLLREQAETIERLQQELEALKRNMAPTAVSVVSPSSQPPSKVDEFEPMTVAELTKFAKEEELNLGGAKTRDEILKVVRKYAADMMK